jgi:hypothetical protein
MTVGQRTLCITCPPVAGSSLSRIKEVILLHCNDMHRQILENTMILKLVAVGWLVFSLATYILGPTGISSWLQPVTPHSLSCLQLVKSQTPNPICGRSVCGKYVKNLWERNLISCYHDKMQSVIIVSTSLCLWSGVVATRRTTLTSVDLSNKRHHQQWSCLGTKRTTFISDDQTDSNTMKKWIYLIFTKN